MFIIWMSLDLRSDLSRICFIVLFFSSLLSLMSSLCSNNTSTLTILYQSISIRAFHSFIFFSSILHFWVVIFRSSSFRLADFYHILSWQLVFILLFMFISLSLPPFILHLSSLANQDYPSLLLQLHTTSRLHITIPRFSTPHSSTSVKPNSIHLCLVLLL